MRKYPLINGNPLHHAAHTACGHRRHGGSVGLLLGQHALRGEEHRGDRRGVLQRYARHLRRVDDTGFQQVLVLVVAGVVTEGVLALLHLVDDHRAFAAGVLDDLAERLLNRTFHDLDTRRLRGKVVMLQFTASWCGVCRKEMPFIEKDIWLKHKDNKAFALFGVDRDEPLETVVAFAKRTGVTYPLALDPGADIFARYADRKAGITRNVLIDKTGKIVMLTRLYNEEEFSSLCKKIDEMLGEK